MSPYLRIAAAAALGCTAMPLAAQCQLCAKPVESPSAIGDSLFPITVTVDTELDFSRMVILPNASGSATLDPRTGARTTSGGLSGLGGVPMRGTIRIQGRPLRRVRVTLPTTVSLTSSEGGSAQLVGMATDAGTTIVLGLLGTAELRFGGTLRVPAGEAGDYRGRIPIEVDYE